MADLTPPELNAAIAYHDRMRSDLRAAARELPPGSERSRLIEQAEREKVRAAELRLDLPVQGDETAEVFSPAWLGTGPEKTFRYGKPEPLPLRGLVRFPPGFGHGFFFGAVSGGFVSTGVWMLLT